MFHLSDDMTLAMFRLHDDLTTWVYCLSDDVTVTMSYLRDDFVVAMFHLTAGVTVMTPRMRRPHQASTIRSPFSPNGNLMLTGYAH